MVEPQFLKLIGPGPSRSREKQYLLLQAHFERRETLSSESRADQKQILRSALKLLQALSSKEG